MRNWDAVEGIEPDTVAWEALALLVSGQRRDVAEALRDLAEARERAVHPTEIDVVDLVEFSLRRRRGAHLLREGVRLTKGAARRPGSRGSA